MQSIKEEQQADLTKYDTEGRKRCDGYAGTVWGNGEFTLGKIPPKTKTQKEESYDQAWEGQHDYIERYEYKYGKREKKVYRFLDPGDQERDPLGLSPLTNSHKLSAIDRKPRGRKGITGKGKRMVRNGAWVLQKAHGKKQLGFCTVTLPSFPDRPDLLALMVDDWSELTRQLFQQVTRYIRKKGHQARWVGVTEIQPKRLKERGEPAPHLHFVYHAHNGDYQWFITANEIRQIWKQIIEARIRYYTETEYSVNTKAAIDTQTVKKDAGAYLGKYMSKGGDVIAIMEEQGLESFIPSTWWHCCTELKRAINYLKQELPSDIKTAIVDGVDLVKRGMAVYLREIIRDEKKYGWVGKLKRSLKRDDKLLQVIQIFETPLPVAS